MLAEGASSPETIETDRRLCFCNAARMTIGLAATALPFARSHSEQAERWLRILRVNGAAGNAMQAIGLPEHPLIGDTPPIAPEPCLPDALAIVIEKATRNARERDADTITTEDVFIGVATTYGPAFDQALAVRGTTAAEILERMSRTHIA
jgi:hypothetical protein